MCARQPTPSSCSRLVASVSCPVCSDDFRKKRDSLFDQALFSSGMRERQACDDGPTENRAYFDSPRKYQKEYLVYGQKVSGYFTEKLQIPGFEGDRKTGWIKLS
jgi:hypothetical protein